MSKGDEMPELLQHLLQVAAALLPSEEGRDDCRERSFPLTIRDGQDVVERSNGLAATTYLELALAEAVVFGGGRLEPQVERILQALTKMIRDFLLPQMYHDIVWEQEYGGWETSAVLNLVGTMNHRLLELYGAASTTSSNEPWALVEPLLYRYSTDESGGRSLDFDRIRRGAA